MGNSLRSDNPIFRDKANLCSLSAFGGSQNSPQKKYGHLRWVFRGRKTSVTISVYIRGLTEMRPLVMTRDVMWQLGAFVS